jgi:hypothetical protein
VSERPGGYAPHHRKVRRQEEILWINGQHFSRIVSLLPSTHNLHAYEERNVPAAHFPLPLHGDVSDILAELYPALLRWLRAGDLILMHQEELGERVAGVVAGFLCWCGVLPEPPRAISAVEQLFRRQMGTAGRAIVAAAAALPPSTGPAGFGHLIGEPGAGDRAAPGALEATPQGPGSSKTGPPAADGEVVPKPKGGPAASGQVRAPTAPRRRVKSAPAAGEKPEANEVADTAGAHAPREKRAHGGSNDPR